MNPLLAGIVTEEEQIEYERNAQGKRDKFTNALNKVMQMALDDCGGSRVCRDFLLSLYNGSAYPFDMNGFRNIDSGLYEACLTIMSIDCRPCPPKEIHCWWPNGDELFDILKARRNKADRANKRSR